MEKFANLAIYCDKNFKFDNKNGYIFFILKM